MLILSPLLQWLYLTALSYFTVLEPPFTHSRGLALAMQLFFAPGNIFAVVLGVGLLGRSERIRRISRIVFLITLVLAAVHLAVQIERWRFDSNALLAGTTLIFAATYFWYFGRPGVRRHFQARPPGANAPARAAAAAATSPGKTRRSRALIACAGMEILLCVAAGALAVQLWDVFAEPGLLDDSALNDLPAEDGLLRTFMFVAFALLLSPHLPAAVASVGLLFGRLEGMARRYSYVVCWASIGVLLLAVWLMTKPELSFDVRHALVIGAFSCVSIVWHLAFLYVLARVRSRAEVVATAAAATP